MSASADALSRLVLAAHRADGALLAAGDDLVADLGLSSARMQVMEALSAAEAPRTVSQLARAMGLSRQAVQRLADDLAQRGLTAYAGNPDHARAQLVKVTEAGTANYAEALQRKVLWAEKMAEGLTPAWLDMAAELLGLIARRSASKGPIRT